MQAVHPDQTMNVMMLETKSVFVVGSGGPMLTSSDFRAHQVTGG